MTETVTSTRRRAMRFTGRALTAPAHLVALEWMALVAVVSWGSVVLITCSLVVWWLVAR